MLNTGLEISNAIDEAHKKAKAILDRSQLSARRQKMREAIEMLDIAKRELELSNDSDAKIVLGIAIGRMIEPPHVQITDFSWLRLSARAEA